MPSVIIDFTIPLLDKLEDEVLAVMRRDCEEQARFNSYGDDFIDKPKWLEFRDAVECEITRRTKMKEGL